MQYPTWNVHIDLSTSEAFTRNTCASVRSCAGVSVFMCMYVYVSVCLSVSVCVSVCVQWKAAKIVY